MYKIAFIEQICYIINKEIKRGNKMKYLKLLLLILIMLFVVGCTDPSTPNEPTTPNTPTNPDTPVVPEKPIDPVKTYKITCVGKYGDIIDVVEVEEGKSAVLPDAPKIKYQDFTGWDQDTTNVTSDMTINAQYKMSSDEFLNNDPNYWLRLLSNKYDITKPLLSEDQIIEYNKNIVEGNSQTKVVDVLTLEKVVNADYVKGLINSYSNINKYTVFSNETNNALTSLEKDEILENRNLNNVNLTINVGFGLIVDFAWMRTYPTNNYSSTYDKDRFQETSLNVGEPVAIYHTSLDGMWSFVQATNYYGWVENKYIGISTYEEVSSFVNANDKLVVISDSVLIENAYVRMGQALPLLNKEECYRVLFPTINEQGLLVLKEIDLEKNNDYSVGYLKYTYENLYLQAFKLLGINYSWGDKEIDGRDCSSTQNSIYGSFGFKLPRNTGNQNSIPLYGTKFSSITTENLKNNYKPGTLIFSSGHVMMYIGENHQGYSYIFHNTSAGQGKCILQKLNSYGVNKIIGTLKLQ